MQTDWKRFGEEAFTFNVVALAPPNLSKAELDKWLICEEQKYIKDILEKNGKYALYNIAYGDKPNRWNKWIILHEWEKHQKKQ